MWRNTHPSFKLNGVHYVFDELLEVGYGLVKEGDPFEKTIGDFLVEWGMDEPTVMVQTSGSTGIPKDITLKKEHMVNSALATGAYFDLQPEDTALLCLPCSSIAGKMMLVRAMVLGLELDYVEPSSAPLVENNKQYNFSAMVPLQVEKSLAKLDQVKTLIIGGATVSHGLKQKLQSASTHCYETYGMTETITHVAVKQLNTGLDCRPEQGEGPIYNSFTTLPGITISQDARGCLIIHAPKIAEEKIITHDLVELINETQFQWLGRFDSIINSGGVKLIPEQIEQKLASLIISRFFVAGIPDKTLGEKLILVIESEATDKSELLQQIKSVEDLDKYEVPKEIFLLPAFVETKSGKVDRNGTIANSFI